MKWYNQIPHFRRERERESLDHLAPLLNKDPPLLKFTLFKLNNQLINRNPLIYSI